ncbi:hypothetical protein [Sanguibacter massiliensis]|uniref:hypothetical protein n=1 Tax=Sanguibacter massiliensis TaxID=1973217 RepID=UPI000C85C041|nr:hypothetical protein [Sanguibacter massiliensis]
MAKKKMPRLIDEIEYHLDEARGQWEYPLVSFAKSRDRSTIPERAEDPSNSRSLIVPSALQSVDVARAQRSRAAACAAAHASTSGALTWVATVFATTTAVLLAGSLGGWEALAPFGPIAAVVIAGTIAIITGLQHRENVVADQVWAERLRRYDERIELLAQTQPPQPASPLVNHRWGFRLRRQPRG